MSTLVYNASAGSPANSLNLATEITPSDYINHSSVVAAAGPISPGTLADGSIFCVIPTLTVTATNFPTDLEVVVHDEVGDDHARSQRPDLDRRAF